MPTRKNVIWITLESTRADHTSMGGHERTTTPNLRRIANHPEGQYFSNCHAHGIWTLASSASILTGVRPTRHGALAVSDAVSDDLDTVPELLSEIGYDTVCFSPNAHLSSATGLDRGFDEFTWIGKSSLPGAVGLPVVLRYLTKIRQHGGGLTTDTRKHGTGYMMTKAIEHWLANRERADDPFFLYAHYGDPHHPYHPPLPYLRKYKGDLSLPVEQASELSLNHHTNRHKIMSEGCDLTDNEWAALETLYDAEIEYTDELIGRLFDYVHSRDVGDTVFVITADHGEMFGEQGLVGHVISVADAVSHVPLVVHGFDDLLNCRGNVVQHTDIVRTLCAAVGANCEQLHGVDMRQENREYAIIHRGGERCQKNIEKIQRHDGSFDASRFPIEAVTAINDGSFKLLQGTDTSRLYDLPNESVDVSADHPGVTNHLEEVLSNRLSRDSAAVGGGHSSGEFTDGMREQLANLGYLVE